MLKSAAKANLKIQFVTGIFPPDIGGPATYIPNVALALTQLGHQVAILTLSDADGGGEVYPFKVSRIRRDLFKPWRLIRTVAALVRAGRNADLFFVHGLYLEALIANLVCRKPLVQKWVGDWAWEHALAREWVTASFEEFQSGWFGWRVHWFKTLRRICARRADALIAPSRYLARTLSSWGVAAEKITPIYNAVDCPTVVPAKIPLTVKCKLITVGRLISIKQIDRIIRVVGAIENAGLVIVGDGPERQRLEALTRERKLLERIYFAGKRTEAETLAMMAASELFVLNSTHEGLPHVVLEAMSLGLPVVATAVGGTPEVVHDGINGVLIAPQADDELRAALSRLAASPAERKRLAEQGRRTAAGFRFSRMIEQTAALLEAQTQKQITHDAEHFGAVAARNH